MAFTSDSISITSQSIDLLINLLIMVTSSRNFSLSVFECVLLVVQVVGSRIDQLGQLVTTMMNSCDFMLKLTLLLALMLSFVNFFIDDLLQSLNLTPHLSSVLLDLIDIILEYCES